MPVADRAEQIISDTEANRLFASLLSYAHLVLAVSGGADSVALMQLAARSLGRGKSAPKLMVLSVDHGLRPEAAEEAGKVARWAEALGLEHHILCWQGEKPASGLQAAARAARYRLMSEWCLQHGAQAIVTAHTANDQAETVMMRLARGSGVDGLAGMSGKVVTPWPILRPLLGVTRQRLRATLVAGGHDWIEDPSNEDERFERIRMRKALGLLEPLGITADSIALSARRLARASHALDIAAQALLRSAFVSHDTGFGELDLDAVLDTSEELRLRVLQMLVWQFGSHDMPRMAALERVAEWIVAGDGRARTISGCRIARRKKHLVIGREPGRIAAKPLILSPNDGQAAGLWDHRFQIVVRGAQPEDQLSVVPLATLPDGQSRHYRDAGGELPGFVRASLPVLLNRGTLHSVPHLGILAAKVRRPLTVDVKCLAHQHDQLSISSGTVL